MSETITVKSFHTLFCPVYVLDSRAQSAGGPGPPKWKPCSCIGVYLGHSPFHAGSVALVFNPPTGRVSPQYHVVFDDTFLTVPFMDNSMVPPHWADLHKHSTERATNEEFNLAEEWMKKMPDQVDVPVASSRLTDPFALIPDQNQAPKLASNNTSPEASVTLPASKGANKCTLASVSSLTSAAAPLSWKARKLDTNNVARIRPSNDFDSPASAEFSFSKLTLSPRINLYKAGFHRSPRLLELAQNATCSEKAHVTWSKSLPKLVSLFTLFCFVSNLAPQLPSHKISPTASFTNQMANRLHEVNKLYDGTLNDVISYAFSTLEIDTSNNEVFTYSKAMKEPDANCFIEAMQKEVQDHESRNHWEIVPGSSIPSGMKTIQAIWSFKHKRYPNGSLNKHKACLCAHNGMQQWGVSYWETYSPVVNMLTVRLLLALCNIHKLESKSTNFVLTFPQAELNVDIWMELLQGIAISDCEDHS
jgi:hypothetical protein